MLRVEQRQVDRLLQVEAVMDAAQEQAELPLLLLVAARRAEGEARLAVLEGERRRQRRARALARARARRAGPPPARTSARASSAGSRAPGSPARIAASRPTASPRSCCPICRSTSIWTVSPRRGRQRPSRPWSARRRCAAGLAPTARHSARPPWRARPAPRSRGSRPGRSSCEAVSPISLRRPRA